MLRRLPSMVLAWRRWRKVSARRLRAESSALLLSSCWRFRTARRTSGEGAMQRARAPGLAVESQRGVKSDASFGERIHVRGEAFGGFGEHEAVVERHVHERRDVQLLRHAMMPGVGAGDLVGAVQP